MRIRTAGTLSSDGDLIATTGRHFCGQIRNGISLRFEHRRGSFVVDFDDLRAVVKAAEDYRATLTPEQLATGPFDKYERTEQQERELEIMRSRGEIA